MVTPEFPFTPQEVRTWRLVARILTLSTSPRSKVECVSDNELSTRLLEWEARIVLEALIREEERLESAIAVSTDENEMADLGNDLLQLRLVLGRLKEEAVAQFGKGVLNFDKGPL